MGVQTYENRVKSLRRNGHKSRTPYCSSNNNVRSIQLWLKSHLPFVRQTRLELLARVFGVLDVDELFMDWC